MFLVTFWSVFGVVDMRNGYSVLAGKAEGKRPFRRPMCKCEDNIRMDVREIG